MECYSSFARLSLVLVSHWSPATNRSLVLHAIWLSAIGHCRSQRLTRTNDERAMTFQLLVSCWYESQVGPSFCRTRSPISELKCRFCRGQFATTTATIRREKWAIVGISLSQMFSELHSHSLELGRFKLYSNLCLKYLGN